MRIWEFNIQVWIKGSKKFAHYGSFYEQNLEINLFEFNIQVWIKGSKNSAHYGSFYEQNLEMNLFNTIK